MAKKTSQTLKDRDAKGHFLKGNQLSKGNVPYNKIEDEFSNLPISRQMRYYLRRKASRNAKSKNRSSRQTVQPMDKDS